MHCACVAAPSWRPTTKVGEPHRDAANAASQVRNTRFKTAPHGVTMNRPGFWRAWRKAGAVHKSGDKFWFTAIRNLH